MLERALFSIAFSKGWGRQMRFITGPRQSGKTTLAKAKLKEELCRELYYLWDLRSVRDRYKENQMFFTQDRPPSRRKAWICFDELHKLPKWKNALKAIFDGASERYQFVVTGSAKFELFKKAGDSLAGRYFTFHLFPLSLREANRSKPCLPTPESAMDYILDKMETRIRSGDALRNLLEFGGFPEPFLKQSKIFQARWADDYMDTVIKEDIGALTRIIDREYLYDLYRLLPEMVGSPISESSLAAHLQISPPTIKNYLRRLADFYLTFKVPPYSKNIKRALIKAPKCYLYDWTRVRDDSKQFENYVAVELNTMIHLWQESSEDRYSLFYVRTKEKEETDFLILKNDTPWLLIEAKLSDGAVAGHHRRIQTMVGHVPLVQVCRQQGVASMDGKDSYRMSAARFFA